MNDTMKDELNFRCKMNLASGTIRTVTCKYVTCLMCAAKDAAVKNWLEEYT